MKSSKKKSILLFALCLFVITGLQAQPDFKSVQDNVTDRLAESDFLGCAIAYIYPDGRTQFISRGSLSSERSQKVDKNTIFEIGSITKTFTTLIMMKMAEEGHFSLDTPIETILPDSLHIPSYNDQEITLKHLATHTAGLPNMPNNIQVSDAQNPYAGYTTEQMYRFLDEYQLTKAPSSSFAYSNLEVGLLGHLLELESGKSYAELLQQYITRPLEMMDTGITVTADKEARFAEPYNYGNPVKHWDLGALSAAGAIRSTASDMATYMKAQMGLQISDLETAIEKTHQNRFDTGEGHTDAIGLGWFFSTKEDTIMWHNGATGGFKSFAGLNKETGAAVVVLSNGKDGIEDIGFHLLDPNNPLAEKQQTVEVDSVTLGKYTGTYQHASGVRYYVSREGTQLMVQLSGQQKYKVYPKSTNRFFYKVVAAEIEFSSDSAGKSKSLTLYQGGQEIKAERISDTAPSGDKRMN